jgi:hypothetical protein
LDAFLNVQTGRLGEDEIGCEETSDHEDRNHPSQQDRTLGEEEHHEKEPEKRHDEAASKKVHGNQPDREDGNAGDPASLLRHDAQGVVEQKRGNEDDRTLLAVIDDEKDRVWKKSNESHGDPGDVLVEADSRDPIDVEQRESADAGVEESRDEGARSEYNVEKCYDDRDSALAGR